MTSQVEDLYAQSSHEISMVAMGYPQGDAGFIKFTVAYVSKWKIQ
jgi:hypothetical protein